VPLARIPFVVELVRFLMRLTDDNGFAVEAVVMPRFELANEI